MAPTPLPPSPWVFEPAGNADHEPFDAGSLEPLQQALYLDVVRLVAIVAQHRRVGGHEWKPFDPASQVEAAGGRSEVELDAAERGRGLAQQPRIVAERVAAHALLPDAADIDIGYRDTCERLANGALAQLRKVYAPEPLS